MPQVAPYSGAMLLMVARSASGRSCRPGPKNSTNFPTTPFLRSISVTVSTRSVAVAPSGSSPSSRKPITSGLSIELGLEAPLLEDAALGDDVGDGEGEHVGLGLDAADAPGQDA